MDGRTCRAIETKYKGYRFRSRLEARWAVFLDALGLEYQYEPEGFELKHGRYLPDFWVPAWGLYLEIKGSDPSEREIAGPQDLTLAGKPVMMVIGDPWPGEHFCQIPGGLGISEGIRGSEFVLCSCRGLSVVTVTEWSVQVRHLGPHTHNPDDPIWLKRVSWPSGELQRAYEAARSARFEHGETPA